VLIMNPLEKIQWPGPKRDTINIIDLTHSLGPGAPVPTGTPKFESKTFLTYEKFGISSNIITMTEHHGTHIEAPSYTTPGKLSADKIPLSQLIGPAAVIKVKEQVLANPDYSLTLKDFRNWENIHGKVTAGAFVLLATGRDESWDKGEQFYHLDNNGKEHTPGFSQEVCEFLMQEREIRGIGLDCGRPEGSSTAPMLSGKPIQRYARTILASHNKIIIENLKNLMLLPDIGALLIVGVIPFENGAAAQARIFAMF
jgi:kynurenine formamidase